MVSHRATAAVMSVIWQKGVSLMKIAFIGYGQVGAPLADHLQRVGYLGTLAANDPNFESVSKALARNAHLKVAAPKQILSNAVDGHE